MKRIVRIAFCTACFNFGTGLAGGLPGADDEELLVLKGSHQFKEWQFIDQRAGDCHMTGVLTIFDNGVAFWAASSMTESTSFADMWHESLQVNDSEARPLFGFGVWDSPGMQDDGSHYFWKARGEFPKALFDSAAKVSSAGEC